MEKKKERGSKMDFEKAKLNPAAVFKSPQEVVSIQELSREQKIEILRRWEQDARLMEVAEEESMPGPQALKKSPLISEGDCSPNAFPILPRVPRLPSQL
jgi:hypothetical protein